MYPSCRYRFFDDVVVDGRRVYFVVDVVLVVVDVVVRLVK